VKGGAEDESQAPIAFRMQDGGIRVNELRWLAVGDLAEINTPQDLGPVGAPKAAPKGKGAPVDPLAKTGAPVDPLAKTGAPVDPLAKTGAEIDPMAKTGEGGDPVGDSPAPAKPGRQTNYTPPPKPKVGPRGYTPVAPEVVVEAYRINPHSISTSGSTEFHNQVWRNGGGTGKAPVAFRVGKMIRVNIEAFPAELRTDIGHKMYLGR